MQQRAGEALELSVLEDAVWSGASLCLPPSCALHLWQGPWRGPGWGTASGACCALCQAGEKRKYALLLPKFSPQSLSGPSGDSCGKPQLQSEDQPHLQRLTGTRVNSCCQAPALLVPLHRERQAQEPLWVSLAHFCDWCRVNKPAPLPSEDFFCKQVCFLLSVREEGPWHPWATLSRR